MERGLLAIKLVKYTLGDGSGPLEAFNGEEPQDIKKAWQLGKKILEASEIDGFRHALRNYAD